MTVQLATAVSHLVVFRNIHCSTRCWGIACFIKFKHNHGCCLTYSSSWRGLGLCLGLTIIASLNCLIILLSPFLQVPRMKGMHCWRRFSDLRSIFLGRFLLGDLDLVCPFWLCLGRCCSNSWEVSSNSCILDKCDFHKCEKIYGVSVTGFMMGIALDFC